MTRSLLLGLRILVVEDDAIIALDIAGTLADAGATVIGPVYRVAPALDLLKTSTIDIAVLDYRLESDDFAGGRTAFDPRHPVFVLYQFPEPS